jgi:hypothetical protein
VATIDTAIEPRQPNRSEKKKNTAIVLCG